MKISKTQFKNLIRCDRFPSLNELYKDKGNNFSKEFNDEEIEDLQSFENNQYKKELISNNFDDEANEELIEKDIDLKQVEMLMPFYNELEMISGRTIKKLFSGEVIYDKDTYKQKVFNYARNGFNFYCFLDGYQEDSSNVRIFETKATTSKKFKDLTFKDNKQSKSFFVKNKDGIYIPREDTEIVNEKYYEKEKKLFDPYDKIGKYIYDLSYQRYVFENSNSSNKNKEYYLIVLNNEYVYDGKKDINNKEIYNDSIIEFFNLTSITKKMMDILSNDTSLVINRINSMNSKEVQLGKYCEYGKTSKCPFLEVCYNDFPEKNSIFVYKERHHGFTLKDGTKYSLEDLIEKGFRHALDVPNDYLNREKNVIQRRVIETKEPYYNKEKIRSAINLLKYPIYHLDFESFNPPLPRFKGEKPYDQSLFQFSIHIEKSEGVCHKDKDHYGFLSIDHKDYRKELLLALLSVIKSDSGSILVYNESFEKSRLKELQILYPEYHDKIQDLINRIFDLQHIVESNTKLYKNLGFSDNEAKMFNFYHEDLNGSFSIKKVLPIFSDLSYDNLEVGNGNEAMQAYYSLPSLNDIEYKKTYNDMIEYCKQDTWAMFEILKKLRQI